MRQIDYQSGRLLPASEHQMTRRSHCGYRTVQHSYCDSSLFQRPVRFRHEEGFGLEGLVPQTAGQPSVQRFLQDSRLMRPLARSRREAAGDHHQVAVRQRHLEHLEVAGAFPLDWMVRL